MGRKIQPDSRRAETEAQLLTLSGMVSRLNCQLDEARVTLTAVLSRGETLGKPRVQLGALGNLAYLASALGQWDESASWGARYRALAHAIGSRLDVARGQLHLALAAQALGEPATAIRWHEQSLVNFRATGDRRMAAVALRYSGGLHLELGNLQAALQCCAQAQTLHQTVDETLEACMLDAQIALCECRLGQPEAALSTVNALLDRLASDLADNPAHETLDMRWTCQQVLEALGDARAAAMLDQLYADVHARAAELNGRGRDEDCSPPAAQIRTCGTTAYGSCLES